MDKIISFFADLYEQFIALPLVKQIIDYCKENVILAGIIGGLILLIIVVLCIMGGKRRKAKKAAETPTTTPVEDTQTSPAVETVAEAPVEEKASVEEEEKTVPVEEKAPVEEEEKTVPVEEKAPVKEEEKTVPVEEKAPVEEEKTTISKGSEKQSNNRSRANDVDETIAMVEDMDDEEEDGFLRDHYDENEIDRIARYKGKWLICRVITNDAEYGEMYFFELRASNGEKLLESEEYTTYPGAIRGIQTHKTNILNGNFKIAVTKKGDYMFKLLSGKNMLLCTGENYPTRARCQSAIDSTIRFAATAILDENVQDIVIRVPAEDDSPVEPLPENCNGKWLISSDLNADGKKIYYFELYANNGERLLESEEYTTYTGAVNGINTHKKNIEKNNFRITLTKRGDFVYKLLNANGQLLCLGEHYKTKRLCQNAVESVKRFAMSSPMFTEEPIE